MATGNPPEPNSQHPELTAVQHMLENNRWLIHNRYIYTVFILFIIIARHLLTRAPIGQSGHLLMLLTLPVIGNLLFHFDLKRKTRLSDQGLEYDRLLGYATHQLDFDLVVICLFVFFSGSLRSPLAALFVFYIILSTFLLSVKKALRNTLVAMLMLLLIFLLHTGRSVPPPGQLVDLLAAELLFILTLAIAGFLSANQRQNERLLRQLLHQTHELSISDGLTGLFNQTHFFELLELETKKSARYNLNFSLIMLDVDNFKHYNDHNGHLRGSEALKSIADLMRKHFRSTDILAKYGGDEFVIIAPQTDRVGAFLAAERLREITEREHFPGREIQPHGRLTISLGIASFPEHGQSQREILEKADKAMYQAKEQGRNRTVIYHDNSSKTDGEDG